MKNLLDRVLKRAGLVVALLAVSVYGALALVLGVYLSTLIASGGATLLGPGCD